MLDWLQNKLNNVQFLRLENPTDSSRECHSAVKSTKKCAHEYRILSVCVILRCKTKQCHDMKATIYSYCYVILGKLNFQTRPLKSIIYWTRPKPLESSTKDLAPYFFSAQKTFSLKDGGPLPSNQSSGPDRKTVIRVLSKSTYSVAPN